MAYNVIIFDNLINSKKGTEKSLVCNENHLFRYDKTAQKGGFELLCGPDRTWTHYPLSASEVL